jgi:hypothetical protein
MKRDELQASSRKLQAERETIDYAYLVPLGGQMPISRKDAQKAQDSSGLHLAIPQRITH